MRKTTLLILVVLQTAFHIPSRAKDDMDRIKADYYYEHLAFYKAIPYYEKLALAGDNPHVYARLADCYRLTGDLLKADEYFRKLLDMHRGSDASKLKYARVLMQLMRYEEADTLLKEYQLTNPRDRRIANMIEGCRTAPDKLKASYKGKPVFLALNTDRSEFAPTLWNGNLVFTADTAIAMNKRTSGWTGSSCYNIYTVPCYEAGNCGTDYATLGTPGKVNIEWHNGPAAFNPTGDTMYFTRTRYNNKFFSRGAVPNKDSIVFLEIMIATDYDDATMKFNKVKPFAFNSSSHSVAYPTISNSNNLMVFCSNSHGSGTDLYMCRRNKAGKWMRPQSLGPNVNTDGEEVFPFLANDSTLFFASDGHPGLGGLDIYRSSWDKGKGVFLPPVHLGIPVNSSYDDISMALTPDGTGYFSSNRPAEAGGDNIYYYKP